MAYGYTKLENPQEASTESLFGTGQDTSFAWNGILRKSNFCSNWEVWWVIKKSVFQYASLFIALWVLFFFLQQLILFKFSFLPLLFFSFLNFYLYILSLFFRFFLSYTFLQFFFLQGQLTIFSYWYSFCFVPFYFLFWLSLVHAELAPIGFLHITSIPVA